MADPAKKKILVIDDEEKFASMIKKNLEALGKFEVRVETKGAQGLQAAKDFKPDLILLDVIMPDKRGTEVAIEIRETEKINNTPIVFLTATVGKGQSEAFGGVVGGRPFTIKPALSKPVSTKDLVKCIEDNLAPKKTPEDDPEE
ncbi:MAG TPA: response regulator [Verrucomicrobiae bacterium]|jgi:CheY-like chemotaxis protein|nr:response regulator [Verrucomicrobiae bacterium]